MATVSFSVPDDVKDAFDETFRGRNKSAVVAGLMREAVERARRRERSRVAINRIRERRRGRPVLPGEEVRRARRDSLSCP